MLEIASIEKRSPSTRVERIRVPHQLSLGMEARTPARPIIDRMLQRLAAEYAPERVILFGSHATGTADADSGIDLLIIKDTPERFLDRWTTVQHLLTGLHPSTPVETLVLTPREFRQRLEAGDAFLQTILDQGKTLYES